MVHSLQWVGLVVGLLAAPLALEACQPARPASALPEDSSFEDFSTPRVGSLAEFRQLAGLTGSDEHPPVAGAKFVITSFSDPSRRRIHYLDGRRYRFHDEWAWFRLLNGQAVSGLAPLERRAFGSPEAARRWAVQHEDELPDGLALVDGRLYAQSFYDASLSAKARPLGAGSLIHVEARAGRPELWGFEIDYTDPAHIDELEVFLSELRRSVPQEVRARLNWFARSPEQLAIGRELQARDPSLAGRVLTYDDVSLPGETVVYTSGIVAGRLRAFPNLARLAESEPEDILLLDALPAYLPQARGLVTTIPQTPLAHLNLLAKSRQIVNLYRGGVLDEPQISDLARSRAPVVLAAENGQMRIHRLTEKQYRAWQESLRHEPLPALAVDASRAPFIVDLSRLTRAERKHLGPLIGGKAVGMAALLESLGPPVAVNGAGRLRPDVPDRPLAITIRAYREHLAPHLPLLRALFADENFRKFKKLRFLALEGVSEFTRRFPSKKDRELSQSYQNPLALGPIAAAVRQGGVAHSIRHSPLAPSFEAELTAVLARHFAGYAPEQGLRFRSSSTVEDIEGSSGAGLYDSATGYLNPRPASATTPKRASVADALRKTWASYFSAEAFEERHQSGVEHLAADMAVLVHARFDDALEAANGVFTFTLAPGAGELLVDAQPGAVSVTNPPTDRVVIPESTRVRRAVAAFVVERRSLSSLAKPSERILTDAELGELFELAERLTRAHLASDNEGLPPAQQRRSLVLDFEFRRVAAGWPALLQGRNPPRFVVKQMRPLEPSPHVDRELRDAPIPRDVLARARRIETRSCRGRGLELTWLSVFTNAEVAPDLGYSARPLVAGLGVRQDGISPRVFTHLEQRSTSAEGDSLQVELEPGLSFAHVEVRDGAATLSFPSGKRQRLAVDCEAQLAYAEPQELLRSFLAHAETSN